MSKDLIWAVAFIFLGLTVVVYDPLWLHHPITIGVTAVGAVVAWGFVIYDVFIAPKKEQQVSAHAETQIGRYTDEQPAWKHREDA